LTRYIKYLSEGLKF